MHDVIHSLLLSSNGFDPSISFLYDIFLLLHLSLTVLYKYLDELAQCVIFASGNIDNDCSNNEDDGDLLSTATTIAIPIVAIQQAARQYRESALLGPVPLLPPAAEEESSLSGGTAATTRGGIAAWTNFEEKYHGVGEPTFELVLERRGFNSNNNMNEWNVKS
jgi:hypothetical protein